MSERRKDEVAIQRRTYMHSHRKSHARYPPGEQERTEGDGQGGEVGERGKGKDERGGRGKNDRTGRTDVTVNIYREVRTRTS